MAILTHDDILTKIKDGSILIEPFDQKKIGPASIDLTLDNKFRVFKNVHEIVHLKSDEFDFDAVSTTTIIKDFLTLMPGQTLLGITKEKITLPTNICGWIQGRSRFARIGLMVHITASFIQPGISNKQVLEMNNAGPMPIAIHPGISVCQLILEETSGDGKYQGKFKNQQLP